MSPLGILADMLNVCKNNVYILERIHKIAGN